MKEGEFITFNYLDKDINKITKINEKKTIARYYDNYFQLVSVEKNLFV